MSLLRATLLSGSADTLITFPLVSPCFASAFGRCAQLPTQLWRAFTLGVFARAISVTKEELPQFLHRAIRDALLHQLIIGGGACEKAYDEEQAIHPTLVVATLVRHRASNYTKFLAVQGFGFPAEPVRKTRNFFRHWIAYAINEVKCLFWNVEKGANPVGALLIVVVFVENKPNLGFVLGLRLT